MENIEKVRKVLNIVKGTYMEQIDTDPNLTQEYKDGWRHATVLMDINVKKEFKDLKPNPEAYNIKLALQTYPIQIQKLKDDLQARKNTITKLNDKLIENKAEIEERDKLIEKLESKIANQRNMIEGQTGKILRYKSRLGI